MFHYALSTLGEIEEVEEVMQEVFLKVAADRRRIAKARSVRAYLFAMLRHEIGRHVKRQRGEQALDIEHLAAPRGTGLSDEDAREVERALAGLPEEQREAVVLKVYEGLTFREIAEVMKTPPDTAASRYRYALEKLRVLLSDKAHEG